MLFSSYIFIVSRIDLTEQSQAMGETVCLSQQQAGEPNGTAQPTSLGTVADGWNVGGGCTWMGVPAGQTPISSPFLCALQLDLAALSSPGLHLNPRKCVVSESSGLNESLPRDL